MTAELVERLRSAAASWRRDDAMKAREPEVEAALWDEAADALATTTREDAPGAGGGVPTWGAFARAACEAEGGNWVALDNTPQDCARWFAIGRACASLAASARPAVAEGSAERCEAERLTWAKSNDIERMSDEAIRAWREAWLVSRLVRAEGSAEVEDLSRGTLRQAIAQDLWARYGSENPETEPEDYLPVADILHKQAADQSRRLRPIPQPLKMPDYRFQEPDYGTGQSPAPPLQGHGEISGEEKNNG